MASPHTEISDLEDQFAYELAGAYEAEIALVDALDEMAASVTSDSLREAFATHSDETETHVRRAEAAFEALGRDPWRRENPIVDGLLEARAAYEDAVADDDLRNLHYLSVAMKTERIEMTSYEGLLLTAKRAGIGGDVTHPLRETLENEEQTFQTLQEIATGSDLKALWDRLTG